MNNKSSKTQINPKRITRNISRKDFLALAWKGLLGLSGIFGISGLWRFFSYQQYPPQPTRFDLGPVDELPKNSLITVSEADAALITTEDGFRALSLECPHLGCIVEPYGDVFICPCHNSQFTLNGDVLQGPAGEPLRTLEIIITEENHLIINTSENS